MFPGLFPGIVLDRLVRIGILRAPKPSDFKFQSTCVGARHFQTRTLQNGCLTLASDAVTATKNAKTATSLTRLNIQ